MIGSDESREQVTGTKRDVLSPKVKTRLAFSNVKTIFETGRLEQSTAEIKIQTAYVKADGQALKKSKNPQVKQFYIPAEKMLNTKKQ